MNLYNNYYQLIPCILITTGRLYCVIPLKSVVEHRTINGSVSVRDISLQVFIPVLQTFGICVEVSTSTPFLSKTFQYEGIWCPLHPQVALNMSPGDIYMIMSVKGHGVFVPCLNILPEKV